MSTSEIHPITPRNSFQASSMPYKPAPDAWIANLGSCLQKEGTVRPQSMQLSRAMSEFVAPSGTWRPSPQQPSLSKQGSYIPPHRRHSIAGESLSNFILLQAKPTIAPRMLGHCKLLRHPVRRVGSSVSLTPCSFLGYSESCLSLNCSGGFMKKLITLACMSACAQECLSYTPSCVLACCSLAKHCTVQLVQMSNCLPATAPPFPPAHPSNQRCYGMLHHNQKVVL
jgi:hypothetical protein